RKRFGVCDRPTLFPCTKVEMSGTRLAYLSLAVARHGSYGLRVKRSTKITPGFRGIITLFGDVTVAGVQIEWLWIESPQLGFTLGTDMAQSRKHNAWNEVMGLVLLGVGTVLFLALISYTPKDVPSWVWFSSISPPNNPAQNFIGPTGAIVAGFLYLTLGAASYLVATIFLGFGGSKLFLPSFRIIRRLPWAALFIISGASLINLQIWALKTWRHDFNIMGPGGWTGHWFGMLLLNLLGQIGSMIALAVVYIVSLTWLTGIRPIHAMKQATQGLKDFWRKTLEGHERRR